MQTNVEMAERLVHKSKNKFRMRWETTRNTTKGPVLPCAFLAILKMTTE